MLIISGKSRLNLIFARLVNASFKIDVLRQVFPSVQKFATSKRNQVET